MTDAGEKRTWLAGAPTTRALVAQALDRAAAGETLRRSARREIVRVRVAAEPEHAAHDVVLKRFHTRRPLRTAFARALGRSAARREWRALALLFRAGAAVPEPLALLRDGSEEVLATRFVPGAPLATALAAASARAKRAILASLAAALRAAHDAGVAHGDLHAANVLVDGDRVAIVDWQRARRAACERARRRDIAMLELSLALEGATRSTRLRLRRAALGERATRDDLRAHGRSVDALAFDHYRGRTRRCLRPGRRFARVEARAPGGRCARGLRVVELPDSLLERALAALDAPASDARCRVLKDDARARVTRVDLASLADGPLPPALARSVVVKEVRKGGLARRIADVVRGSPARRAWIAGHGLAARRIEAARPLAFLEIGGIGRACARSLVVLTDLGGSPSLDDAASHARRGTTPDQLADALVALALALHRRGVDHGDLQASHVFGLDPPALIDLEGLRFAKRLSDARRIAALAELNASIADSRLPAGVRARAFVRYARALPFAMLRERALREIVRRSLARSHAWRGADCEVCDPPSVARR